MFHLGALEILFSIQDAIVSYVRSCRDEPELAQEIFNDLALQILDGSLICKGETPDKQRAYLKKAAYHRLLDYVRRRNRRPDSLPLEILEALVPFVDETLNDSELWLVALRQCLLPLPESVFSNCLKARNRVRLPRVG